MAIDFDLNTGYIGKGAQDEHGTRNANGHEPVFFLDFVMTNLEGRFSCSQ